MPYEIEFKPSAEKDFSKLERDAQKRILEKIKSLASDPRPRGVEKLSGHKNRWRIRVGRFRIIYQVFEDKLVILVLRIADRIEIYR